METKHTPTPWGIEAGSQQNGRLQIVYSNGEIKSLIAVISQEIAPEHGGTDLENAALIVRAVNSHEALLEAAKILLDIVDGFDDQSDEGSVPSQWPNIKDRVLQVIVQAEGK